VPRASVVVPVRDRRALLGELLDALEVQTFTDVEVIVVDDGSTDGSAELAEQRGVAVIRGDGQGAVAARQLGVKAATGDVLAFTDSDCVPEPGWLEAGVRAIDAGADVVQGHTRSACRRGLLERSLWVEDDGLYETCNVFYRRSAFDAVGGFDDQAADRLGFRPDERAKGLGFGEDTLLGWRVRRQGRAAYVADAVVAHAVFPPDVRDQLSRTAQAAAFPALLREVPELRGAFLRHGVLLGGLRVPLYVAVGLAVVARPRLAALALGWWVVSHWRNARRLEPSRRRCLKALPVLLATDALTGAALVVGSVRARSVVL
jgi:glycosyltransferase involved in cell wall biosynthesis